jgi:hypothetical protein
MTSRSFPYAVKTTYLRNQWGRPMHTREVLAALGLPPTSPIPPTYMDARRIGEVLVLVLPQHRKGKDGMPNRRVVAECPDCKGLVCAGHLHQHVGTRACVSGVIRRRQVHLNWDLPYPPASSALRD